MKQVIAWEDLDGVIHTSSDDCLIADYAISRRKEINKKIADAMLKLNGRRRTIHNSINCLSHDPEDVLSSARALVEITKQYCGPTNIFDNITDSSKISDINAILMYFFRRCHSADETQKFIEESVMRLASIRADGIEYV